MCSNAIRLSLVAMHLASRCCDDIEINLSHHTQHHHAKNKFQKPGKGSVKPVGLESIWNSRFLACDIRQALVVDNALLGSPHWTAACPVSSPNCIALLYLTVPLSRINLSTSWLAELPVQYIFILSLACGRPRLRNSGSSFDRFRIR